MAVAAAAVGVAAVVSLHHDRQGPLLGAGGHPASSAPPTSAPESGGGTSSTTTVPSTVPSGAIRTAVGKSESYGYGVVSVKVTVRGTRILNVTISGLQTPDPTSQSIAEQAIPILKGEVIAAQSARINAVSGATYTSEGYAYSLQSALDKLHVA